MSGERLFFALWPSIRTQASLAAWGERLRASCRGRATASRHIHLTLLYLGRVPDEARARMPGLGEQGAAGPGFDLLLDRIGHFPRSGIIWAGTTSVPDALVTLHQRLVGAARELGLDPPARDFLPHVTLLRAAHAGPDWQPERVLCWPVDGFRLVASRLSSTGPDYTTLATWSLGPTPGESVGGGATDDAPDEA